MKLVSSKNQSLKSVSSKNRARIINLIISALVLSLLISGVFAEVKPDSVVEINSTSSGSITWYYNYTSVPLVAALDGVKIENFDNQSHYFTASNLDEKSYHTFCIYVENQNCETGNTTSTQVEETFSIINIYAYFLIALICLVISAYIKLTAYLSLVFSLIGILQCIGNDFYMAIVFVTMTLISIASLGYDRT